MERCKRRARLLALLMAVILVFAGIAPVSAAGGVQISKGYVTISADETYQLRVTVNGSAANASWGSSDSYVATVSQSGLVTGKKPGTAIITATVNGTAVECQVNVLQKTTNTITRYNVLILDASGSMQGKPDTSQKIAAKRFCSKVLSTSGNNYVAVVTMNSSARALCGFTNNYSTLESYINSVYCGGTTNIEKALSTAGNLLSNTDRNGSNVIKNIVLCSDGLPTTGQTVYSGRYDSNDHSSYRYANAAYNTAYTLKKKGNFIYALGFFHSSTGNDLRFGKRLMKDLASRDKYYIIQDSNDLNDVFEDIANTITNTTMSRTSLTISSGQTYQLRALNNGVAQTASWKSSNSKIVYVSQSGKIKGVYAGTATVTATVKGKSVTCKVKVKPSIKLSRTSCTLSVGEKILIKKSVKGTKSKVTWKSSNSYIAVVDKYGVVRGKRPGKVTITAGVGGAYAKCTVTVKKAEHPLYSVFFSIKPQKYGTSSNWKYIDEDGMRIVLNDSAVIEKCGAYAEKRGQYWYVTLAFKGKNVVSPKISCYVGYKGKLVDDGLNSTRQNVFSLTKDSKGVWSIYGRYQSVRYNVTDIYGNLVTDAATGKQGVNTKFFSNLDDMKKWLSA